MENVGMMGTWTMGLGMWGINVGMRGMWRKQECKELGQVCQTFG